jgi:hypothetical protein
MRRWAASLCWVLLALLAACGAAPSADDATAGPRAGIAGEPARVVASPPAQPWPAVTPTAAGAGAAPAGVLRVGPGDVVYLGAAADTVTLTLQADGGDVAWTAGAVDHDWLSVERSSGVVRAGVAETLTVRVDRAKLRQVLAPSSSGLEGAPFRGNVAIRTPQRAMTVSITGRQPPRPLRQCSPGGDLIVEPARDVATLTVRAAGRCADWYLISAPPWLALDVEVADPGSPGTRARSLIVDPERRLRPFTTAAGDSNEVGLLVDWRRVPEPLGGMITIVEASRDVPVSLAVHADPVSRTVRVTPAGAVPTA